MMWAQRAYAASKTMSAYLLSYVSANVFLPCCRNCKAPKYCHDAQITSTVYLFIAASKRRKVSSLRIKPLLLLTSVSLCHRSMPAKPFCAAAPAACRRFAVFAAVPQSFSVRVYTKAMRAYSSRAGRRQCQRLLFALMTFLSDD